MTKSVKHLQEIKMTKLNGDEVVVQNNMLIEAPRFTTLQEQKLFLFLISMLNPQKQSAITFRIKISDFAKAMELNHPKNLFRDIRSIIKNLGNKIISIHGTEDGCNTVTDIPLLGYAKYWEGRGYFDIKISQEITPFLFNLKREFTQYKLSQITRLSSIYALRIYELLKKQETIGCRTFFIDDLRKKLNIKPDQYAYFKDFRERVLEIAKREINDKTDLAIDYQLHKTGRRFTSVQFTMTPKKHMTSKTHEYEFSELKYKFLSTMTSLKISRDKALSLLQDASDEDIHNAIDAVNEQVEKGNTRRTKAMMISALNEKWKPSKNWKSTKRKSSQKIATNTIEEKIIPIQKTSSSFSISRIFKSFLTKNNS